MNECTHNLDYQLIDEGQKTTKRDNSKEHITFRVVEAWISMSNDFNIILLDNPCRKVELAESQYSMENSSRALVVIFWFKELLP